MARDYVILTNEGRNFLKNLRVGKEFSQNCLAKQLGINQVSIFDWESGRYNPTIEKLRKLLRYFKVDVGSFLENGCLVERIEYRFKKIEKKARMKVKFHPSIEKQIILTESGRKYIKTKRKCIGSQNAVSVICNFDQSVISLWETGITSPTISRFKIYLDVIRINYNGFVNNNKFVSKVSEPFIGRMISKSADSRRKKIKSQENMNKHKAYIMGVLGPGDCYVGLDEIELAVTDKDFAERFLYYIKINYGVRQSIKTIYPKNKRHNTQYKVRIHAVNIVEDLNNYKVSYKEKIWGVPKKIDNSNELIKAMYLKGVYDSQAHVNVKKYGIIMVILNINGLRKLRKLLNDLGIKSTLLENNSSLNIYGKRNLELYNNKIGFEIKRKKIALNRLLKNYK